MRQVDAAVLATFTETRSKMLPVHDSDLAKWALETANKIGLQFLASKKWIYNFKRRHELVSRKVTKVHSSSKMVAAAKILEATNTFRNEVLAESPKYSPQLVFNTDQSGFQYEFYSTRTLSFKGEKDTPITVKSMNKTTHSYSIQPTLGLDGKLHGPLYLCLQEIGGRMGTRVKETYFRAPIVEVTCSSSGKLTTSLFERYVDYVLGPLLTGDCLLLLDSWGGQQSDECFQGIENLGFTCTRLRIPEGATPTTQPLDVFYNRQYKGVFTKFYNHVSTQGLNINLYQRDHIIKLHSLVHHQFANDRFAPMGRYAWYASGLSRKPPHLSRRQMKFYFLLIC